MLILLAAFTGGVEFCNVFLLKLGVKLNMVIINILKDVEECFKQKKKLVICKILLQRFDDSKLIA